MNYLKSDAPPSFHVKPADITDKRQSSGRLVPVFPSLVQGTQKEEDYIARMIRRDREAGLI